MLSLSRRPGEVILIGDNIRIIIGDFHRGAIKVGIEAPKDILILREELLDAGQDDDEY